MSSRNLLSAVIMAASCMSVPAGMLGHTPGYYAPTSELASGHWIRIKVTDTGMQQISHDQLRQLGFTDPDQVSVYGYGGVALIDNMFGTSLPDDLPLASSIHTDEKLIFYGESDVRNDLGDTATTLSIARNAYSTGGYYFLSDCHGASAPIPDIPYNAESRSNLEYHTSLSVSEAELTCPARAGTSYFGADLTGNPDYSHTFTVDDPYASTATVRYAFAARAQSAITLSFTLPDDAPISSRYTARANGLYESNYIYYNFAAGYLTFALRQGDNQTYTIYPALKSSSPIEYAAIDYIGIIYRRHNNATARPEMRMAFFNPSSTASFTIKGLSTTSQVWDVTDPQNIGRHQLMPTAEQGTYTASFGSRRRNNTAYLQVFDPTQELHSPTVVGPVTNQDLHSLDTPDLLIVTTSTLRQQAEDLAELHRIHQGMTVHVVDQQEAFNEFSSGTPHPMGIRRLAKMFYDRDPQKFRYMLLYGAGTYDNRSLIIPTSDRLITYQCDSRSEMNNATTAYCSDSYFGMLADSYNHAEIHFQPMSVAVGRIPAVDSSDAATVNSKIKHYLENPPQSQAIDRVLLLADAGDDNSHLVQSEEIADTIALQAPGSAIIKAYNSLYPLTDNDTNAKAARAVITSALSSGVHYMAYCGHGNSNGISFENYYQKKHVLEQTCGFLPIVMMSTCDLFAFDRTDDDMGAAFIRSPKGGSIAIVAASRTVYQDQNQYLAVAMAREACGNNPGAMTGDIFLAARNSTVTQAAGNTDKNLAINCLCYNFGGDPALPVYSPTRSIEIDMKATELSPLMPFQIDGRITDPLGNTLTDFNGTASIAIYGAPRSVNTYPRHGAPAMSVTLDEDLIATIGATVVDGTFSTRFQFPEPERPTDRLHMSVCAVAHDGTTAMTHISDIGFTRDNTVTTEPDTTPPVISTMYLDSPDFTDGDCVNESPVLYATVMPDDSGLNCMASGIGGTRLLLDETSSFATAPSALTVAADGSASMTFHLPSLTDGRHTLRLCIADNAGNTAIRSLSFIVRGETNAHLYMDEYPARTIATLRLSHDFPDTPSGRLVIEDASGNVVYTATDPQFPFQWDLCDNAGLRVPDGEYSAYAILNSGSRHGSTPRTRIIVIE